MDSTLSALTVASAECDRAQLILMELRKAFKALSREVEPDVQPDQQQQESDSEAIVKLASLGVELASKEKAAIRLERDVVAKEQDAGILSSYMAVKYLRELSRRYLVAGDDLWRHQKKKMRLDPEPIRSLDPRDNSFSECLIALYKRCDGVDVKRSRSSKDRGTEDKYSV
ncbi:hypothetical protein ACHAQJ_010345 [Trichoderma viride]